MDLKRGRARAAKERGERAGADAQGHGRVSRAERALLGDALPDTPVIDTARAPRRDDDEVKAFVEPRPARAASAPERATQPAAVSLDDRKDDPLDGFLARLDRVVDDSVDAGEAAPIAIERFLTFDLGPETYASNISDIREIIKMTAVTPVPRAPAAVLGILSKRGVVMPIVDVAAALGLRPPRREVLPDQRILVTGSGDRTVGLRVDRVHGVTVTRRDEVGPVPATVSKEAASFLRGLARQGDGLFIVMDLAALREDLIERADEGRAP